MKKSKDGFEEAVESAKTAAYTNADDCVCRTDFRIC